MSYCQYQRQKKQYSVDGINWYDVSPAQYQKGTLIQCGLESCSEIKPGPDEPDYNYEKWETEIDSYECVDGNKWTLQRRYVSTNGLDWVRTEETRPGSLMEMNSVDCGGAIETWMPVAGYICVSTIQPGDERWVEAEGLYWPEYDISGAFVIGQFSDNSSESDWWYKLDSSTKNYINPMYIDEDTKIFGLDDKEVGEYTTMPSFTSNNQLIHIHEYKVRETATSTYAAFSSCINLKSVNIDLSNAVNIKTLYQLFESCKNIENITFINGINLPKLESLERTFQDIGPTNANSVNPITEIDLLTNAVFGDNQISLTRTFYNSSTRVDWANRLKTIKLGMKKAYFRETFYGCVNLEELYLDNLEEISVSGNDVFYNCSSLKYIRCKKNIQSYLDMYGKLPTNFKNNGVWDIID